MSEYSRCLEVAGSNSVKYEQEDNTERQTEQAQPDFLVLKLLGVVNTETLYENIQIIKHLRRMKRKNDKIY